MSTQPVLTDVLFLAAAKGLPAVSSLGLVVDGKKLAWGTVVAADDTAGGSTGLEQLVVEVLAPALRGAELAGLSELLRRVAALRYHAAGAGPAATAEETPLPKPLLLAVGEALLAALAHAEDCTPAEVLARAYGLALPSAPPPLHVELDTHRPLDDLPRGTSSVASVGYRTPAGPPAEMLGEDGVILQRFLRVLRAEVLARYPQEPRPALHVDVHGGLGELYGRDLGRLLGAIVGLTGVAAPLSLHLENVFASFPLPERGRLLRDFHEYLRFRRTAVALAAGPVDDPEMLEALLAAEAVARVRIRPEAVGDIDTLVRMVVRIREYGGAVLLDARALEGAGGIGFAVQLALGLGVEALAVSAAGAATTLQALQRTVEALALGLRP